MKKLGRFATFGFILFGFEVGFIIGNSITSVSAITVSLLLGFIGSVVSMVIEGKGDDEKISNNMNTLGFIFCLFFLGMILGHILGAILKEGIPLGKHIIQLYTSTQVPKQP